MKYLVAIGIVTVVVFTSGCKKEAHQGRIVTNSFAVQDTTRDSFMTLWWDSYTIQIETISERPNYVEVVNYLNITQSNQIPLRVSGELDGITLSIPEQTIIGPTSLSNDYIKVYATTGYFDHDSIYIDYGFQNRYEIMRGVFWGAKQ